MSFPEPPPSTRRVAVGGGTRIPFARSDGPYATASGQQTLTAALDGLVERYDLDGPGPNMTAGNSTPLTDGAATVLLACEKWAEAHGLVPLAYLTAYETAAVDFVHGDAADGEDGLLMAPAYAVPRMLERAGLGIGDFDLVEVHEAFASQVLATLACHAHLVLVRHPRRATAVRSGAGARDRLGPRAGRAADPWLDGEVQEVYVPPLVSRVTRGSLADLPFENAAADPGRRVPSRRAHRGPWTDVTAGQFAAQVLALARGLLAEGLAPGDRIAVMARTTYEWTLLDFAAWAAGLVLGDGRPYVSALITLDPDGITHWRRMNGRHPVPAELLTDDAELRAVLQRAVDEANKLVSRPESIRRFAVLPADFTEQSGHLTPSMKLRRAAVMRDFAMEVEALYAR